AAVPGRTGRTKMVDGRKLRVEVNGGDDRGRRQSGPQRMELLLLKRHFAIVRHDLYPVAGFELPDQQLRRQWIKHQVLQGALQWPRAELRVESFFRNQLFGRPVNVENELLLFEPLLQAL